MRQRTITPIAASLALLFNAGLVPDVLAADVKPAVAQTADAAPALMLARVWQGGRSPAGFLVSEKYDGVRAVWDGRSLRFRSGLPIAAPAWFVAALPATPLDGELWLGRGQFERLSGIVRHSEPVEADWRELRYLVFDLPGSVEPFVQRTERITALVKSAGQPWLQAVPQERLGTASQVQARLTQLVAEGGEGLMLHRADALWLPGRSDALFKFKPLPDDDARVVAHLPGQGRNAGRLGALLLEMPGGQRFALGSGLSDALRQAPPPIGAQVTYRYRSHTRAGVPRFASFLRVRGPE